MLKHTPQGMRIQRDWDATRIGKAITPTRPRLSGDDLRIQEALLGSIKRQRMEPVPVPVMDTVENLVNFLNR